MPFFSFSRCSSASSSANVLRVWLLCLFVVATGAEGAGDVSPGGLSCPSCFHLIFEVASLGGRSGEEEGSGRFAVEVQPEWCPRGAARIREIAENRVWDAARFFRVVPGFVIQWGIPGQPDVTKSWRHSTIRDDPVRNDVSNTWGTVTFAMGGHNTRTTQIFVNLADNSRLDSQGFPPFGRVVQGMDVVERITSLYRERPNQGEIERRGNEYLSSRFPRLSYIENVTIVEGAYQGLQDLASTKSEAGSTAYVRPLSMLSSPVFAVSLMASVCIGVLVCRGCLRSSRSSKGSGSGAASGPVATQMGVAE